MEKSSRVEFFSAHSCSFSDGGCESNEPRLLGAVWRTDAAVAGCRNRSLKAAPSAEVESGWTGRRGQETEQHPPILAQAPHLDKRQTTRLSGLYYNLHFFLRHLLQIDCSFQRLPWSDTMCHTAGTHRCEIQNLGVRECHNGGKTGWNGRQY